MPEAGSLKEELGARRDAPEPARPPSTGLRGDVIAVLVLSAALCALLGETLFGGKTLSAADVLYRFQPWKAQAPPGFEPGNPVLLDQAIVFQPWGDFARERLRAGELPLWNPYNYAGQPLVASYQSAVYWPLTWLHALFESWRFPAWSAFLRLGCAGLFTFCFLRRLGIGTAAALPGAVGFALSGFMVAWLNHPHTNVALFLPALLWQVERLSAKPRISTAVLLGALIGLQLLGGHIQTSFHVMLAVGAYVLFRSVIALRGERLRSRGLIAFAGACVLGLLLAMPQLLPFGVYLEQSQGARVLANFDQGTGEEMGAAALLMLDPDRYGAPHTGDYVGPEGQHLNYNELIGGYVGRVLLGLALLQVLWLRRGRETWFFAALVAICALIAWQVPPFYALARAVPQLGSTKLMRLLLFVAFGLSVLGSLGLEALAQRLRLFGRRRALAAGAVVLAVSAELLAFGRGYNPAVDPELVFPSTPVTDFLASAEPTERVLGIDNTILMPSANLHYRIPMVSGYDALEYRWMTDLVACMTSDPRSAFFIAAIRAFDRGAGVANLLGVRYVLSESELPQIPGMQLELVLDGPVRIYRNHSALPRAFAARDVLFLGDRGARLELLASPAFDPQVAVLAEPPGHGLYQRFNTWKAGAAPGELPGEVEIVSYEPREVVLEARMRAAGLVVLSDVWDREWTAEVDGEPVAIERVDHALRGVWLDSGHWRVRMRYDPASTRWGLCGAAAGIAGSCLLLGLAAVRRRRSLPPSGS